MRHVLALVSAAAVLAACTPVEKDPGLARYEEHGPKFTAAQKSELADEEKVAIYNHHVPKEHELVCRYESPVGTHFKRPVCRTLSEIERHRRESEDHVAEMVTDR